MYKKILAIGLSAILAMSAAIMPVFADNDKDSGKKNDDKGKISSHLNSDELEDILKYFTDSDDVEWALKSIEKMGAMGILNGVGKGHFKPKNNVTHAEAIAMVLKLTGQKEKAEAIKDQPDYFKGQSDPWSYGYLQLALDEGIIIPKEDGKFNPKTPAKRHEIAKYIVRALDKRDEALDNMNKKLNYNDADSIPKSSIGYVYVISKLEIMTGNGGNFQPNKPITRAEMAVLLDRAQDIFEDEIPNSNELEGTFLSYDKKNLRIKMEINDKEVAYNVIKNVPVYKNNTYYTLSILEPGDVIEIVLDDNNRIIFIEFKEEGTAPVPSDEKLTIKHIEYSNLPDELQDLVDDLIMDVNYAAFKHDNYVYLVASKGQMPTGGFDIEIEEVYKDAVSTGKYNIRAVVENEYPSGSAVTQAVSYTYDVVRFSYFNGIQKVNFVDEENDLIEQTTLNSINDVKVITGKISSIDRTKKIIYVKDANNVEKGYYIASDAEITLENKKVTLASLTANMPVTITVTDGHATKIAAEEAANIKTISGRINSVDAANRLLYIKDDDNDLRIFYIPQKAQITLTNKTVTMSTLKENMPVVITVTDETVTKVAAQKAEAVEVTSGTIISVDKTNRIVRFVDKNDVEKAYYVPADAEITLNNKAVALSALTKDMPVTVTRIDDNVIEVAALSVGAVETIKGTISSVDVTNRILQLKESDNVIRAYYIAPTAKITLDSKTVALSALKENMSVTITRTNETVTTLAAQTIADTETINGKIDSVDTAKRILYLNESNDVTRAYYIPSSVKITLNGKTVGLTALLENMNVAITRVNGVITKLAATQDIEKIVGVIDAVNVSEESVKLLESDNELNTYTIPDDAQILLDSKIADLSDLTKGMKAEITIVDDVVIKLAVQNDAQIIQGVLVETYPGQNSNTIKVKVGTAYKLFVLIPDTPVYYNSEIIAIKEMPLNTTIIIKMLNGVVTEVRNK